jgi:ABC-type sugar transport system ATPase subunit
MADAQERDSPDGRLLLHMRGISKSFSGQPALAGVDFELRAGEVHILAGENGAGKSTLIKILAGVHTDYEGEIELDGRPVRPRSTHEAARHGVSVIHQELSLIPSMSVSDNVALGRENTGALGQLRFRSQEEACRSHLRLLGLDIDPRRRVEEHPLPVQQAIEIAKALSADARILVMDEPTSALTETEAERLFALVEGLAERGCGIVFISHKLDEIYRIGNRITVLRDGFKVGTSDAVDLSRSDLIRWMVGREITERFPEHQASARGPRLEVEGFTVPDRSGRPKPAVDRASFQVRSGEVLGFGGLAGSGASELFQGLFGAFGGAPSGRVLLDGREYPVRTPGHAIRHGLALLTNDRKTTGLVLSMSVARNITLASLPEFSPRLWLEEDRERGCAERRRQELGIRAAAVDQPVASLSGGNQQKVALAKWLETEPRVLLLDEPTRGIDVGAKHEIYNLMREWKERGLAILLITSELPELLGLSDRIVVMHGGRVTAELDRSEASQERVLEAAMGRIGLHHGTRGNPPVPEKPPNGVESSGTGTGTETGTGLKGGES